VLLVGPPGTGKTLLAKAIAGEAGVPFFSISGSDFVEMFVGVGASRVRDMFEQAKKSVPCIIFIDEIDAVGGKRGSGMGGGGNDEREQTLNQLLVEMDGFEENQSIILVAATNRPDILDPALLRPGRFDRQVNVPNPDVTGREQILKVHMRKVPLSPNVDPKVVARGTPGFSGADLANLVNEAALLAARRGKLAVGKAEFDVAKDKIMMGAERRTLIMTESEMKTTAYHEGGHAIVSHYMVDSDPIHKATIVPRGRALGMVQLLPEGDRVSESRDKIIASIKVSMGGRIAEELIFGDGKVTTGAQSDIKAATYYATHMITESGLGDNLGFRNYSTRDDQYPGMIKPYSEEIARKIDDEINALLDKCYKETKKLLKDKKDELHRLAAALLERETLTGDEIRIVLEGGELPPMPDTSMDDLPRTSVPMA
ncbi:MAG: ATP-dependent zinc metalloprotease FtsH, partial [Alphaproteobacteria bacterium]|nr:ATP-dependent zinc metalloprotease FtsH [Alphaproteobacteria bacterium]